MNHSEPLNILLEPIFFQNIFDELDKIALSFLLGRPLKFLPGLNKIFVEGFPFCKISMHRLIVQPTDKQFLFFAPLDFSSCLLVNRIA